MNVRHPIDFLYSFSIKNIFYNKMDLRLFYFDVAIHLRVGKIHNTEQNEHTGAWWGYMIQNRMSIYLRVWNT